MNTPLKTEDFIAALRDWKSLSLTWEYTARKHNDVIIDALERCAHGPQPCDDLLEALEICSKALNYIIEKSKKNRDDALLGYVLTADKARAAIAKYKATQGKTS